MTTTRQSIRRPPELVSLPGGGVSHRPKEHASKACEVKASEGSNPSATATLTRAIASPRPQPADRRSALSLSSSLIQAHGGFSGWTSTRLARSPIRGPELLAFEDAATDSTAALPVSAPRLTVSPNLALLPSWAGMSAPFASDPDTEQSIKTCVSGISRERLSRCYLICIRCGTRCGIRCSAVRSQTDTRNIDGKRDRVNARDREPEG